MPVCFENVKKRDELYSELVEHGIKTRKYFFPLTTNFDYFKRQGLDLVKIYRLEEALNISNRILCLPLYPNLGMDSVSKVVEIIKSNIRGH
jgi:dTDP-4-amino-4,6-dideoxygalactose transaminase